MFKNLSPILSGTLLSALDTVRPGDWIALAASGYTNDHPSTVDVGDAPIEDVIQAVTSVIALHADAPIAFVGDGGEATDLVYAVSGLAADSEGRTVDLIELDASAFASAAAQTALTIRSGVDAAPTAFLVRKGVG